MSKKLRMLEDLSTRVAACRECGLCQSRTGTVFGEGDPHAEIMFVGEAPGEEEDKTGRPFVGAAGRLLDKMITAMGLARGDVYIANTLKCRPPGNRNPDKTELAHCLFYLARQIAIIKPSVIVTLGAVASRALIDEKQFVKVTGGSSSVTKIHGRRFEYVDGPAGVHSTPIIPTYHPAFLLRTPQGKPYAWADLKIVLGILGRTPPRPNAAA